MGHSQLLLRAAPGGDEPTCLDLHFEGVAAVQLGTRYAAPELRMATDAENEALLKLSQLNTRVPHLALTLQTAEGIGHVLCRKVSALRGGADRFGGTDGSEVLWSRRANA
ncbi:hypothetical protein ACIBKX_13505 [Streptomyces sp. NPDC050658]|uniref:hypothetical protein n=1 Tax=unclassified Streptomyces TaxID=2593676 RepID=UPI00341B81D7